MLFNAAASLGRGKWPEINRFENDLPIDPIAFWESMSLRSRIEDEGRLLITQAVWR